jgi:hypothetical protein
VVIAYEEEKTRIINGFKEFTALHDAVEFWEDVAELSDKKATRGLIAFATIGIVVVATIIFCGPYMLGSLVGALADNAALKENPLSYLGFISVPTLIILWGLKFPARIFKEQMHKRDDARHRVTVINTYLSLLRCPAPRLSSIFSYSFWHGWTHV